METQKDIERVAFTIAEFCFRNSICVAHYHKLKREGRAPREMALGRAIRISLVAEEAWRRARELPKDAEARLIALESKARQRKARKAAKASLASPRHINMRRKAKG